MKIILACSVLIASVSFVQSSPSMERSPTPAAHTVAPLHCQVPCGIYGDKMRIDMLMEDCATIEKAMTTLQVMDAEGSPIPGVPVLSKNQVVRWIMTKEQHAQSIQDTVAAYWLAQRVKAPKEASGADKYHAQLKSMHQITVAAMKCKQTTDKSHVDALRRAAREFSAGYFSAEDLEHLNKHEHSEHK